MATEYKLPYTAQEIEEKLGKVVDQIYNPESENAQSGVAVAEAISDMENTINKTTSISEISDDVQYPSAKATYMFVNEVKAEINTTIGDIETALDNIIAIQNTLIGGDSV